MRKHSIWTNRSHDDWESMRSIVYILRWLGVPEEKLHNPRTWIEEEDSNKWSDCEYCGDAVIDCSCHMNSTNWEDFYDDDE